MVDTVLSFFQKLASLSQAWVGGPCTTAARRCFGCRATLIQLGSSWYFTGNYMGSGGKPAWNNNSKTLQPPQKHLQLQVPQHGEAPTVGDSSAVWGIVESLTLSTLLIFICITRHGWLYGDCKLAWAGVLLFPLAVGVAISADVLQTCRWSFVVLHTPSALAGYPINLTSTFECHHEDAESDWSSDTIKRMPFNWPEALWKQIKRTTHVSFTCQQARRWKTCLWPFEADDLMLTLTQLLPFESHTAPPTRQLHDNSKDRTW